MPLLGLFGRGPKILWCCWSRPHLVFERFLSLSMDTVSFQLIRGLNLGAPDLVLDDCSVLLERSLRWQPCRTQGSQWARCVRQLRRQDASQQKGDQESDQRIDSKSGEAKGKRGCTSH